MGDNENRESNVDSQATEETQVKATLIEAETDFSFKIGDKRIDSKITMFDDGSYEYEVPDDVDEEDFKKYAPSPKALMNKANFQKNDRIRSLEEEIKAIKQAKGEAVKDEPIERQGNVVDSNELTYKDYGFDSEDEFAEYIVDNPGEYAKKTMQLTNNMLKRITGEVSKKFEATQLENTLRNQANVDKLDYNEFVKFANEYGMQANSKTYNLFKKTAIADRDKEESLRDKQKFSVSYRSTGSPTSTINNNNRVDPNDPLKPL